MAYPIYETVFTATDSSTMAISGQRTSETTTDSDIVLKHVWPDESSSEIKEASFAFDDASQAMDFAFAILDVVSKTNSELLDDISDLLKVYKPHKLS